MKTMRRVVGLMALLSLVGCASQKASVPESTVARREHPAPMAQVQAQVMESKEGGFRVHFPFPVEEERSEQSTSAGPLTLHTYVATDPEQRTAYYVSYTDFPVEAASRVDPQEVLARASIGAVDSLGATDVTSKPLMIDGIPGQEVTATAGNSALRGRFYMVGPRLYQQLLIHPAGQPPEDADQFFSSFRVDPEMAQALGGSGRASESEAQERFQDPRFQEERL